MRGNSVVENSSTNPKSLSHTGFMNYDEACIIHLYPGVVHRIHKDCRRMGLLSLCTKK